MQWINRRGMQMTIWSEPILSCIQQNEGYSYTSSMDRIPADLEWNGYNNELTATSEEKWREER